MKELLIKNRIGFVDLYLNDVVSFKKLRQLFDRNVTDVIVKKSDLRISPNHFTITENFFIKSVIYFENIEILDHLGKRFSLNESTCELMGEVELTIKRKKIIKNLKNDYLMLAPSIC